MAGGLSQDRAAARDPLTRIAEIRQENSGGDVRYADIEWLCNTTHTLILALEGIRDDRTRTVAGLQGWARTVLGRIYGIERSLRSV